MTKKKLIAEWHQRQIQDFKQELIKRYNYCNKLTAAKLNRDLDFGLTLKEACNVWVEVFGDN